MKRPGKRLRPGPTVRTAPIVVGIVAGALALVALTVPPWVIPPIQSIETGPAAIEMVQFKDGDRKLPYAALPEPLEAADNEGSPKASEVYENVQVLGNLTDAEFTRLMLAITEWVSPEQGCEYCHNLEEGFASDTLYTKVVARQMLKMTRHVNASWANHVAPSGVTCYTCHRGQNVPPWTWYEQKEPGADQFLGKPRPWHLEAKTIRQFFPSVPYQKYLLTEHSNANIQSSDPLVGMQGSSTAQEQDAENLYLFMMQMSNQMGINCTFCHNSRAFRDWSQSTPYRWIAYWGIRMARDINTDYIQPLASVFPDQRKGPLGDPAKVHCGTCHLGNNKPLGGYKLLDHYLVGLTEDGKAPDPSQKQAILLGTAKPIAETNVEPVQYTPVAPTVNEKAVQESVAPANSSGSENGQGPDYKSQTEPGAPAADPTLGGTVTPAPDQGTSANKPDESMPTGTEAPQGALPEQTRPNGTSSSNTGTADAPSTGTPPSNPLPPASQTDKATPAEPAPPPSATESPAPAPSAAPTDSGPATPAPAPAPAPGGSSDGAAAPAAADGAAPATPPPSSKGPAQGTTSTYN